MTKILIGVDDTARSEDAIALARTIARGTSAQLDVVTVLDRPAAAGSPVREQARETVRRMSGLLAGVPPERVHTGVIESRSPAQGLHELADKEDVALLIVGSTHTGHLGRVRPGSTAERLLAGAPCAVAVAPYGYRSQEHALERVGVAYDGSADAKIALDAAVRVTRALGATLELITVIPADVYGAPALMTGAGYVAARMDIEADIRRDLDTALAELPGDIAAEGTVLEGRPWKMLAERSADLDLLLVGSRGYGPLQSVILGGTSGPLMREAHCPVIALPRGARDGLRSLYLPAVAAEA